MNPIPRLEGAPTDPVALKEAFVTAWLAFRKDIDVLPRAGVHPLFPSAVFNAAPKFVARDAAKLAVDPNVALAAAARLSRVPKDKDRAALASLVDRYRDSAIAPELLAFRIKARDRDALNAALSMLEGPQPFEALAGAVALAEARDVRGLEFIRSRLDESQADSEVAARALGAVGDDSDVARLHRAKNRGVSADAVDAGLGALALRRISLPHWAALAHEDPSRKRLATPKGTFDGWLGAIGRASNAGAGNAPELLAQIAKESAAAVGKEGEPLRRELAALVDFWAEVDGAVAATSKNPLWPHTFVEALEALATRDPRNADPTQFAKRFSAAVSLLSACGQALDYERLSAKKASLRFVTFGGERASDDNFATSWRGKQGASLVFDLPTGTTIRRLWIAAGCPDAAGASVSDLTIAGGSDRQPWTASHRLTPGARYFEGITLERPRGGRISITIGTPKGATACISELRVE